MIRVHDARPRQYRPSFPLCESVGLRGYRFFGSTQSTGNREDKRLVTQTGGVSGSASQQLVDATELLAESFCVLAV